MSNTRQSVEADPNGTLNTRIRPKTSAKLMMPHRATAIACGSGSTRRRRPNKPRLPYRTDCMVVDHIVSMNAVGMWDGDTTPGTEH